MAGGQAATVMNNDVQDVSNTGNAPRATKRTSTQARTPPLISPPDTKTPPTEQHRRDRESAGPSNLARDGSSEPLNPTALTRALHNIERQRDGTAGQSPSRKRPRLQAEKPDRFMPSRAAMDLNTFHTRETSSNSPATPSKSNRASHGELNFQRVEQANSTFENLLRTELFDETISRSGTPATPSRKNVFNFTTRSGHPTPHSLPRSQRGPNLNPNSEMYSLSPIKRSSQSLLLEPRKQPRSVSKVPYKVLDAPELADDFYLNLVDWGSQNILGVGLGNSVYMWNSESGRVTQLCDLQDDTVTSVSWIQRGSHIAIGTGKGFVQIWDAVATRRLRTMTGHTARVGALAWNDHILTSGSRDRLIYHRDVRQPDQFIRKLAGHRQEVCGLKWNPDDGQLASGGNDNMLMVWEKLNAEPTYKWKEHQAAVKAIAWSPHQRGLLASGGGTADRCIKFWNTLTSPYSTSSINRASNFDPTVPPNLTKSVDTGSQVCNLAWSINSNELVSTHGYSQNQIVVWKYPSMQQVVSLTGHTFRVLYLAMSPDGQVIVTGAGDETLRFWNTFKKRPTESDTFLRLGSKEIIR